MKSELIPSHRTSGSWRRYYAGAETRNRYINSCRGVTRYTTARADRLIRAGSIRRLNPVSPWSSVPGPQVKSVFRVLIQSPRSSKVYGDVYSHRFRMAPRKSRSQMPRYQHSPSPWIVREGIIPATKLGHRSCIFDPQ